MRAKDIMSTPVITASPSRTLKEMAKLLLDHDISAIPIVDEAGALVGIVSEDDILPLQSIEDPRRHMWPRMLGRRRVPRVASEVMSKTLFTVTEDEDVTRVARLMHAMHVKRVPVVADGHVTGIISRRDILKVLARTDVSIQAELQQILDDQKLLLGQFYVGVSDGLVTLSGSSDQSGRSLATTIARGIPGVVAVRFEGAA